MKQTLHTLISTTLLLQALLLSACSDTLSEDTPVSGGLSFVVTTKEMNTKASSAPASTQATTRATEETHRIVPFNTTLHNQPLYLRVSDVPAIGMHSQDSELAATRGTLITSDNDFYDSFLAAAYDTEAKQNAFGGYHTVTRANSWSFGEGWPDGKHLRFYTLAPTDADGITISDIQQAATASVGYTVPQDVDKQKDLMGTVSDIISEKPTAPIPLKFYHMLTCVRFAIDDVKQGITIHKVILHNIHNAGICSVTNLLAGGYWTTTSSISDFTYNLDLYVQGQNQYIQHGNSVFLLMPQTLPDNASVEIVYKDGSSTKSLKASIGGQQWLTGHTVTYHVTTSKINQTYELAVTPAVNFAYTGNGDGKFTVTSYKRNAGTASSGSEPVGWEVEGYYNTDGTKLAEKPEWLTLSATKGDGSLTPAGSEIDVTARTDISQSDWTTKTHTEILKANTTGGSNENTAVDLSLRDAYGNTLSSQNTANCYVVRGPGWYRIPMVYGNGIQNGATNTDAWTTTGNSTNNRLNKLVNDKGDVISEPWISTTKGWTTTSGTRMAAVLWRDVNADVIPNKMVNTYYPGGGNHGYISFYVDPKTICQSNVLLGLYDSNDANAKLVWSYHIWITDEDLTPISVTNATGKVNKMMPVPLGFVDDNQSAWNWATRSVVVKIKQNVSNKTATFTVTQHGTRLLKGHAPYYQWGRKDPMPGTDTYVMGQPSDMVVHKALTFTSAAMTTNKLSPAIAASIQNPTTLYQYSGNSGKNWLPWMAVNLWDNNISAEGTSDKAITKTVYDPCPDPFHAPSTGSYTAFMDDYSTSNTHSSTESEWNIATTWNTAYPGFSFYTEPDAAANGTSRTYATVFVPAMGYMDATIGSTPVKKGYNTAGSYWTAGYTNLSSVRAGALYFHYDSSSSEDLSPLINSNLEAAPWYGRTIIPTTDE